MAAPNAAHGTRTGRWAAPSPATYRWSSSASAAGEVVGVEDDIADLSVVIVELDDGEQRGFVTSLRART